MRKILLVSVFITISGAWLIAASSDMVVSFPIAQGFDGYIDFGFSTDSEGRNRIDETTFEVFSGESSKNVYAYWDVLSTESFILRLYSEPLNSIAGRSIDWVVSWNSGAEIVSIGGIDKYGVSNGEALFVRDVSIGNPLHESGSKKLGILVPIDDSTISGEYSGRLVMQLESIE